MKCKDCNSMCKYRSSDAEKECFYSQPQHDNLSTELKTYEQVNDERHWQDVRERAAIAVMQAIISNSCYKIHSDSVVIIPKNAVIYADGLVKQLQEKDYGSNR